MRAGALAMPGCKTRRCFCGAGVVDSVVFWAKTGATLVIANTADKPKTVALVRTLLRICCATPNYRIRIAVSTVDVKM